MFSKSFYASRFPAGNLPSIVTNCFSLICVCTHARA